MAPGSTGAPYDTTRAPVLRMARGVLVVRIHTHSAANQHHIGSRAINSFRWPPCVVRSSSVIVCPITSPPNPSPFPSAQGQMYLDPSVVNLRLPSSRFPPFILIRKYGKDLFPPQTATALLHLPSITSGIIHVPHSLSPGSTGGLLCLEGSSCRPDC